MLCAFKYFFKDLCEFSVLLVMTMNLFYYCFGVYKSFVYKIPYRRAPRLAYRPSASREQRYLAYKQKLNCKILVVVKNLTGEKFSDHFSRVGCFVDFNINKNLNHFLDESKKIEKMNHPYYCRLCIPRASLPMTGRACEGQIITLTISWSRLLLFHLC